MDNNIDIRLEALRIAEGDVELARTYVDFILGTERKGFIERMREEEAKRADTERAKRRLNARFGKLADEPVYLDPFNTHKRGSVSGELGRIMDDLLRSTLYGKVAGAPFPVTYADTDSLTVDRDMSDDGKVETTKFTFRGEPLSAGAIMQLNSVYGKTPKDPNSGWCVDCDTMHDGAQWTLLRDVFGWNFVREHRVPNTAA
ncbi:hypothetical protein QEJ61_gp20 [Curtobacterium phage Pize]|uniref:hypothetical protein n=1 Tax=Curtobacterium phage Pize TaxID=2851068 RepID=UPI002205D593|nr:hypothetical protein QEJ61_gp20 [Curtobacterium phage Pize]QXG07752.1 hypothetical protein [Curtobacterium phage Pize]